MLLILWLFCGTLVAADCDRELHAYSVYVRLIQDGIRRGLIDDDQIAAAMISTVPVNPLANQALDSIGMMLWRAFDETIVKIGDQEWARMREDLTVLLKEMFAREGRKAEARARNHTIYPVKLQRADTRWKYLWGAIQLSDGRPATLSEDEDESLRLTLNRKAYHFPMPGFDFRRQPVMFETSDRKVGIVFNEEKSLHLGVFDTAAKKIHFRKLNARTETASPGRPLQAGRDKDGRFYVVRRTSGHRDGKSVYYRDIFYPESDEARNLNDSTKNNGRFRPYSAGVDLTNYVHENKPAESLLATHYGLETGPGESIVALEFHQTKKALFEMHFLKIREGRIAEREIVKQPRNNAAKAVIHQTKDGRVFAAFLADRGASNDVNVREIFSADPFEQSVGLFAPLDQVRATWSETADGRLLLTVGHFGRLHVFEPLVSPTQIDALDVTGGLAADLRSVSYRNGDIEIFVRGRDSLIHRFSLVKSLKVGVDEK